MYSKLLYLITKKKKEKKERTEVSQSKLEANSQQFENFSQAPQPKIFILESFTLN